MNKINTVGIDLAKNTFHLCIQDAHGHLLQKHKFNRAQLKHFLATTTPSIVAFESCATAHYWSRQSAPHGHSVKLIHPGYVKAYVKTNKNDFNDAEAICEAASRPSMRFVAPKTIAQQDVQLLHRIRQRQVHQRTALVNQIRGQLLEYGIAIPQGVHQLRSRLMGILEDGENELTPFSRELIHELGEELRGMDNRIHHLDEQIKQVAKSHPVSQRLMAIPGVGPMIATALLFAVSDIHGFKNGREFSAWLGLVPRQYSTGGKPRLLGISKRGDGYVRALLVQGALSALTRCKNRSDSHLVWARQLKEKKGLQKSAVALANKMGRIIWSLMSSDRCYQPVV